MNKKRTNESWQDILLRAGTENNCGDLSAIVGTVGTLIATAKAEERYRAEVVIRDLMEPLADIEHKRWAKWQKYMHEKMYSLNELMNNHLKIMPTELFNHWERQISTPYPELSEREKESDREQVRPYMNLIINALR